MKKYYPLLLLCFLFYSLKFNAQSSTQENRIGESFITIRQRIIDFNSVSNYHFYNPFSFNPAMAGNEDKEQFNLDWNRQMNHAISGSYERPISSINSNVGMQYEYQATDFGKTERYALAYNYGIRWKEDTQLKFGIQSSLVSVSVDGYSRIQLPRDSTYHFPSLDFGVAFLFKQFRFGASVQNLVPKKFSRFIESSGKIIALADTERTWNFSAASTFSLAKNWDWSLAFLLRFNDNDHFKKLEYPNSYYVESLGITGQHDLSTYFSIRKKYSFGATYRWQVNPVWIGFVGLNLNQQLNLQFSCNVQQDENEPRFWQALTQFKF